MLYSLAVVLTKWHIPYAVLVALAVAFVSAPAADKTAAVGKPAAAAAAEAAEPERDYSPLVAELVNKSLTASALGFVSGSATESVLENE